MNNDYKELKKCVTCDGEYKPIVNYNYSFHLYCENCNTSIEMFKDDMGFNISNNYLRISYDNHDSYDECYFKLNIIHYDSSNSKEKEIDGFLSKKEALEYSLKYILNMMLA